MSAPPTHSPPPAPPPPMPQPPPPLPSEMPPPSHLQQYPPQPQAPVYPQSAPIQPQPSAQVRPVKKDDKKKFSKIGGVMFIVGAIFALLSIGVGYITVISGIHEKLPIYTQFALIGAPLFALIYGMSGAAFAIKVRKFMVVLVSGIFGVVFALVAGLIKIYDARVSQPAMLVALISAVFFLLGIIFSLISREEYQKVKI